MSKSISFWQKHDNNKACKVYIIGGGLVGLSAAHFLCRSDKNIEIHILERDEICGGASIRNAGFACFGSPTEIIEDVNLHGAEKTRRLIQKRWDGLQLLLKMVGEDDIDYYQNGAYELIEREKEDIKGIIMEANAIVSDVFSNKQVFSEVQLPWLSNNRYACLYNHLEGQLNPYKLVKALQQKLKIKGVQFHFNVDIEHINFDTNQCHDVCGKRYDFDKLIIATNAYTKDLLPMADVMPVRNQVYVTNVIENLEMKGCFHVDKGYIYFRNVGNRVLIGGARNQFPETEETKEFGNTEALETYLLHQLRDLIPNHKSIKFEYKWSGILGVGKDKNPIIRKINDYAYAAYKMGGMGVAIGSIVGKEISDMLIQDIQNG